MEISQDVRNIYSAHFTFRYLKSSNTFSSLGKYLIERHFFAASRFLTLNNLMAKSQINPHCWVIFVRAISNEWSLERIVVLFPKKKGGSEARFYLEGLKKVF